MAGKANGSNRLVGAALALAFLLAAVAALYLGDQGGPLAPDRQNAGLGGLTPIAPSLTQDQPGYQVIGQQWAQRQEGRTLVLEILVPPGQDEQALWEVLGKAELEARGQYSRLAALRVEAFPSLDDLNQGAKPLATREWSVGRTGVAEFRSSGEQQVAVPAKDTAR